MFFLHLWKQIKWKIFKYLELCMPHSQAPLHSAYKLVVLFQNKLQLWVWDDMCGQTYTSTPGSENPKDQSNFIWFCIGCLLPCSDGEKEKLKLLTIAYFVEKVSWIWIRYLKLPAKCFRSCIRHFTNLSSRETLASKEWILGRTRKTLVNNVFWVRLRKNSVSSRGLEQIIQQCFFKRTPLRTSFSIFVSENTIANRAKKSPTIYVVVVGMFFSTLMKTN